MKLICCSVYDKSVEAFLTPFFVRAKGEAVRSFMDACADEKHQFAAHLEDYALFAIGEFDDGNGEFKSSSPERLMTGFDCKKRPE